MCESVSKGREGIVQLLEKLIEEKKEIHYSKNVTVRWFGIRCKICPYEVPKYADCSSFVSWVFWTVYGKGEDKLNKEDWKKGTSWTMSQNGIPVSEAHAKPGDIVFYGTPGQEDAHVAIYIGNDEKGVPYVANFGSKGPVKKLEMNYRTPKQIRRFIGNDKENQFPE
jgi:hypothetical protein